MAGKTIKVPALPKLRQKAPRGPVVKAAAGGMGAGAVLATAAVVGGLVALSKGKGGDVGRAIVGAINPGLRD
jgi:hypothetical protein